MSMFISFDAKKITNSVFSSPMSSATITAETGSGGMLEDDDGFSCGSSRGDGFYPSLKHSVATDLLFFSFGAHQNNLRAYIF